MPRLEAYRNLLSAHVVDTDGYWVYTKDGSQLLDVQAGGSAVINGYSQYECIDAIADIETLNGTGHLSVRNTGSGTDIILECTSISDVLWLKLIQYGKVFSPDEEKFSLLFDKGFKISAIECLEDVVDNKTDFENSEIHSIVFDAIASVVNNGVNYQTMLDLLKGQNEESS